MIYTIEGPLFFGGVNSYKKLLQELVDHRPKVLLLRMGNVPLVDTTGEAILASAVRYCKMYGGKVILSGLQPQPKKVMVNTGLYERIGANNIYPHTGEAVQDAIQQLEFNKCFGCKQFAFHECTKLSTGTYSLNTKHHFTSPKD